MDASTEDIRDLNILEHIEEDPDITQASLASQIGVAVGTVNWHIQKLVEKGYVKVKRAQRKKLRYIITPQGIAHRASLTVNYIEHSMRLYRRTRSRVTKLLQQTKEAGYTRVRLATPSQDPEDIMDVCRLTCLEQGVEIVEDENVPVLVLQGFKVALKLPEGDGQNE
jgi:DNA-binding MarR family transcriptional regulator